MIMSNKHSRQLISRTFVCTLCQLHPLAYLFNNGSIVIDIPYPIWEQLMNQGKEVEISLPSQPMFDFSEQKASGSTTPTTGTE